MKRFLSKGSYVKRTSIVLLTALAGLVTTGGQCKSDTTASGGKDFSSEIAELNRRLGEVETGGGGTPTPTPEPSTTRALIDVDVDCRFEFEDEDDADQDKSEFQITSVAIDDKGEAVDGTAQPAVNTDENGEATVKVPEGYAEVTCRNTTGEELTVITNTNVDAPSGVIEIDPIADALWDNMRTRLASGGYLPNSQQSGEALLALQVAAKDHSDFQDAWEEDTFDADAAHITLQFLAENGDLLRPLAKDLVCVASEAGTYEIDVSGLVADGDNLGDDDDDGDVDASDVDFEVVNTAEECELSEFNGTPITLVYTVNGISNTDADNDGTANSAEAADQTTCNGFDSDNDTIFGAIGRTIDSLDAIQNGSMEWYAMRLSFGSDRDNASHKDVDAIKFGAAFMCQDTSDDDCTFESGSIALGLGGARPTIFCDSQDDFDDEVGNCEVNDETTGFVISSLTRANQDENSVVYVVKNCSASENTRFTYNPATSAITLAISGSPDISLEDEDEKFAHFGFVLAQLDPADDAKYNAIVEAARQNMSGDDVASIFSSRKDWVGEEGLLPYELGILLATGRGLCDKRLEQLGGGDDVVVGRYDADNDTYLSSTDDVGGCGFAPGEEVSASCQSSIADAATHIVDENGCFSLACELKSGDSVSVTVASEDAECTVE